MMDILSVIKFRVFNIDLNLHAIQDERMFELDLADRSIHA